MKATAQDTKASTVYPKLRRCIAGCDNDVGIIVLFKTETEGTVVVPVGTTSSSLGYYGTTWKPENFVDFDGHVILEN